MKTRVGIIGYGGFGRFLHRAWSQVDGVIVSAVADPAAVSTPDGVRYYASWEELLEQGEVDVVSIATPPSSHSQIATAALNRNVHVLVEKPIATTLADATEIVRARDQSSHVATVDFMLRYNPIVACIQGWCKSKAFGELQRVVVENYAQDESLVPSHWFWDSEISGGIQIEHGVHFFDLVNGCTSSPVSSVTGRSWSRQSGLEDRVFALVEYEDGLVASFYHAFNRLDAFERTSLRFVFDGAQVDVKGWIPMHGRIVAMTGDSNRTALDDLPNLAVANEAKITASRAVPIGRPKEQQHPIDTLVTADFALAGSKEQAYLSALRALMTDMVGGIHDPSHKMRVTLEDGVAALNIAVAATDDARAGTRDE